MNQLVWDVPHPVFVDTQAFYVVSDTLDVRSVDARETLCWFVSNGVRLVTTNVVVAELHALFIERGRRENAREMLLTFETSRGTTVIRAAEEDE